MGLFVALVSVCAGMVVVPEAATPPAPFAFEVQVMVAPGVVLVRVTRAEVCPEQMDWLGSEKFTMGAGFTFLGVGMVAWGKYLMPKGPFVEERHPLRSSDEEREAFASVIANRGGGVVKRRPLLGALLGGGMGVFGVVALFPLLRSLGPLPKKTLEHTDWKKGSYLVTQDGRRIHVDDFIVNEVATVFPEGFQDTENGQAVDQTIVIRLDTEDYVTMKGRESWAPSSSARMSWSGKRSARTLRHIRSHSRSTSVTRSVSKNHQRKLLKIMMHSRLSVVR